MSTSTVTPNSAQEPALAMAEIKQEQMDVDEAAAPGGGGQVVAKEKKRFEV